MKNNKLKIKGFTLIELLIVMGVLAVLMGVIVVGIDPLDKIESARDSKAQQDANTIATAMEAYAAGHEGDYPCNTGVFDSAAVVLSGELKAVPSAPSGRTYNYSLCTATNGAFASEVKSKKFTTDTNSPFYAGDPAYWVWCASSGKAEQMTSVACP